MGKDLIRPPCEVCGSNNRVQLSKKYNKYYCSRHAKQMWRYGEIVDPRQSRDDDVYFIDGDSTVVKMYDRFGRYKSKFIIDTEDLEMVKKYKWCLTKGHISTSDANNKTIYLHRYIMGVTKKEIEVDHKDGDPLNNKKENLRLGFHINNMWNHKICSTNTSGVTGVTWDKERNKWVAQIVYKGKNYHLGRYDDFEDAKIARKEAEKNFFGDWRRQNG